MLRPPKRPAPGRPAEAGRANPVSIGPAAPSSLSLGERVQGWLTVDGEVMINPLLSLLEPAAQRTVVEGDCAGRSGTSPVPPTATVTTESERIGGSKWKLKGMRNAKQLQMRGS